MVETVFGRIKSQFRITVELLSNLSTPKFFTQLEILCATGRYYLKVINSHKARFGQMKLEPEVSFG